MRWCRVHPGTTWDFTKHGYSRSIIVMQCSTCDAFHSIQQEYLYARVVAKLRSTRSMINPKFTQSHCICKLYWSNSRSNTTHFHPTNYELLKSRSKASCAAGKNAQSSQIIMLIDTILYEINPLNQLNHHQDNFITMNQNKCSQTKH